MNDNIITSCEEFIEKRISTKFLSKGKEIDWQFIRNFNYKNSDEIKEKIKEMIDDGLLEDNTTYDDYIFACDRIELIYKESKECRDSRGSSIITDKLLDNESRTFTSKRSAWVLYKNKLLNEKHFSKVSIKIIENDTEIIRKRLSTEYSEDIGAIKGMVVGAVQSGKTANMGALISQCADNGWNFFIILGGMLENLRIQTEKRLINDFSGKGMFNWFSLSSITNKIADPGQELSNLDLSNHSHTKYLCVTLKQKDRLNNLLNWIKRDTSNAKNMRVLIIDDEADQASINTKKLDSGEQTTINKLVNDIVNGPKGKQLCGAMNYICYTATPYANFLNDSSEDGLYPNNFITTLTPPKSYFGPQEIFGVDEDGLSDGLSIIRNIDSDDESKINKILEETSLDIPNNLKSAICWFLCSVSAFRFKKIKKPFSMLVNISYKTDEHSRISNAINNWLSTTKIDAIINDCKKVWDKETNLFSYDTLKQEFPDYEMIDNVEEYPNFNEIKPYLKKLIEQRINYILLNDDNSFEYSNGIHLCIDNYKNNKINEDNEYKRIIYPEKKQLDAMKAPAFIIIGGNTLSRGLTLEGLVSTYFFRKGRQADSLMQMGRWFGYRFGYELYPRIWMDEITYEQFTFLSKLDYDLRMNLEQYMIQGISPRQAGPLINNTPSVSWLRITARNKQQSVIEADYNFSGVQAQTISFDTNEDIMNNNIDLTKAFLKDIPCAPIKSRSNSSFVWKNVDYKMVYHFLTKFKFCHNNRVFNNIELLLEWLNKKDTTELSKWNVVLVGVKSGNSWKLSNKVSINKVNRSKKSNIKDYINIGILRTYRDNFEDIAFNELKNKEKAIRAKIKNPDERHSESFFEFKKSIGFDINPMLVIYIIDKNSKPLNVKNQKRLALNTSQDLVGLYLAIPGDKKYKDYVSKLTIKLDNKGEEYYDEN